MKRLAALLPPLSLCILVCACYWRIALAGRVLAGGDVFTYFYPYWAEATRAFGAGRLPLWNPYLFMGAPFLANSQAGVFYPLNWPLWLFLPADRSVHLTIVLHLCLAAVNAYLWARASLRLGRTGAWTTGAVWALGGYLGAQLEHVNQIQGLAWLPLTLTLYDWRVHAAAEQRVRRAAAFAGMSLVIGLTLLAGHTQTAFISLGGAAVYGLGPAAWDIARRWLAKRLGQPAGEAASGWRPLIRRAAPLAAAAALGTMLAAAQIVPTWELTRLSVRASGLPFRERVSFSLSPFYAARALLPTFEPVIPEHMEHVAYVGIAGLALAAVAASRGWARRRGEADALRPVWAIAAFGLFLAFGLYNPLYLLLARLPGFAHFRVPARWLALYALGMAALVGAGVNELIARRARLTWRGMGLWAGALALLIGWAAVGARVGEGGGVAGMTLAGWAAAALLALALLAAAARAPRLAAIGLLTLALAELGAAGSALPHSRATAPQAFTSLRPAIAHLLAASATPPGDGGSSRFLSMSDITFDPGDLPEIAVIYGPQLSPDALYAYVVAVKQKEVLSPNLSLAFGVPAADGFDGGILPLAHYVTLQRLFLPAERTSMDGRLRENLTAIPDGRWLTLFDVRWVITDKLRDAWLDDVFYDLQFGAQLARGESAAVPALPPFEATALGLVSYLRGGESLPDGASVGQVEIGFADGRAQVFELRAGQDTAEGLYGPNTAHAQATVGGHYWPGQPEGNDYVTRLRWPAPAAPTTITIRATLAEGEWVVHGASLIDERTGSFQALTLSDQGRFRLAHSGDVKVYENLDAAGRAFLVHAAVVAADDEAALAVMQDAAFDPRTSVALAGGDPLAVADALLPGESVHVVSYAPERVEIEVAAQSPGYLVLADAWYPGWQAQVDGAPVAILRADLLFRAVAVGEGVHRVVFTFLPTSLRLGAWISLGGAILLTTWTVGRLLKRRSE